MTFPCLKPRYPRYSTLISRDFLCWGGVQVGQRSTTSEMSTTRPRPASPPLPPRQGSVSSYHSTTFCFGERYGGSFRFNTTPLPASVWQVFRSLASPKTKLAKLCTLVHDMPSIRGAWRYLAASRLHGRSARSAVPCAAMAATQVDQPQKNKSYSEMPGVGQWHEWVRTTL